MENINLTHNSKKGWQTLSNLSGNPKPNISCTMTPDQVAHQLLLNGKPDKFYKPKMQKVKLRSCNSGPTILSTFMMKELGSAISSLCNNKAAGLDSIHNEMLKHYGPKTQTWLLGLIKDCLIHKEITSIWRKVEVIALLKPGKDPNSPKCCCPIALLCTAYKLLEWMLLTWIQPTTEQKLIDQQAGFRPGKSCCTRVLNLIQHIEDGFELGMVMEQR